MKKIFVGILALLFLLILLTRNIEAPQHQSNIYGLDAMVGADIGPQPTVEKE